MDKIADKIKTLEAKSKELEALHSEKIKAIQSVQSDIQKITSERIYVSGQIASLNDLISGE
jgi:predicted peptidase